MFVHGGGIFFGLSPAQLEVAASIAGLTGLPTFAIDYRLMPVHRYPAAHDDTVVAYAALAAEGPVVLVGESSGGVLSLAAIQRARTAGIAMPTLWVGISPAIDFAFDTDPGFGSSRDPFVAPEFTALMHREYVGGADLASPDLSPVAAGLLGMPPLIIHYAEHDLLLGHARRLADAAAASRIGSSSREWAGMWHGWHLMSIIPESKEVLGDIASAIRDRLVLTSP